MKRSQIKRRTPLKSKTGIRTHPSVKRPATGRIASQARRKNPSLKTARNKADSLLTPLIKQIHPRCLLCPFAGRNNPTQVAHHHVHKSSSTRLRYEVPNLIPLCNQCHLMLHQNESFWASKIVQLRGIEWFNEIERMKYETVKADVYYYLAAIERLSSMLHDADLEP